MKQILLVDDDFLALNAFYSLTDWAQVGLRIAYEAHSGREALSYLASCKTLPDVAFIDVCMPDMDGISLLSQLRAQYPSIVCFMLSSHSDYPYVRETLKLGAADYLLKHEISSGSIIDTLSQHGFLSTPAGDVETPAQQLLRVLAGDLSRPDDAALRGYLLYAACTDTRPLLDAQRSSIQQTCRHLLNDLPGAAVCAPADSALAIFLPAEADAPRALADASQRVTLLQKALLKYHNAHFSFCAPHYCADGAQIPAVMHLLSRGAQAPAASPAALSSREAAILTLAVTNSSKPLLTQTLHSLFNANADSLQPLCSALLTLLSQIRQDMHLPDATFPPLSRDRAQAQAFFFNQFSILCDQSLLQAGAHLSPAIRDALAYINRHYAEDIQLRDVAQHCHVSYTHLSYLFKKETGDNMIRQDRKSVV